MASGTDNHWNGLGLMSIVTVLMIVVSMEVSMVVSMVVSMAVSMVVVVLKMGGAVPRGEKGTG